MNNEMRVIYLFIYFLTQFKFHAKITSFHEIGKTEISCVFINYWLIYYCFGGLFNKQQITVGCVITNVNTMNLFGKFEIE